MWQCGAGSSESQSIGTCFTVGRTCTLGGVEVVAVWILGKLCLAFHGLLLLLTSNPKAWLFPAWLAMLKRNSSASSVCDGDLKGRDYLKVSRWRQDRTSRWCIIVINV